MQQHSEVLILVVRDHNAIRLISVPCCSCFFYLTTPIVLNFNGVSAYFGTRRIEDFLLVQFAFSVSAIGVKSR